MKLIYYCPACNSKGIRKVRTYRFVKPDINPESDYYKLIDSIVLERLYILFESIISGHAEIDVDIVKCNKCYLYFTNPRLTEDEIKIKYAKIAENLFSKKRYEKYPAVNLDKRADRIYKLLISTGFKPDFGETSILDVGGAWGYNLLPFKGLAKLFVLDFEQWNMDVEIKWIGKELNDLPGDTKFNCIMCLHTLEHIADPLTTVKALVSHLKRNGRLYIEVPLGVFREIGNLKEPITHINFFCEKSLYNLFKLCGLQVIHLATNYQWVTTGRQWCVNIIGLYQNSSYNTHMKAVSPLPGWFQRINPYYYLIAALNKIIKLAGR
jgi:SAM-dependent methyltransferase